VSKPKAPASTIFPWLQANLHKGCLAPLTGTDARALQAAVQIAELYSYDSSKPVADAFGLVVTRMQDHTRELAYHSIAHVMEWSDRERLWRHAVLNPIPNLRRCAFEPGGYVDQSKAQSRFQTAA